MDNINSDEIDLVDLLKKIYRFFRKNSKLFIVAIILGLFLGLIKTFNEPKKYRSNLIAISNVLSREDVSFIIENLNILVEEQNYQELSQVLNIDSVEAESIKKITLKTQPLSANKTETLVTNKFNFEVETVDPKLYSKLNMAIPDILRNNKYAKLKTELMLETKENVYNRIGKEIKLLDSLKGNIRLGGNTEKSTFYMTNPSSIYETIVKLYEQQMEIYGILKTRQDLLVIEEFAKLKKPYNKKLSSYATNMAILAGLLFGIVFLYAIYQETLILVKNNSAEN